MHSNSNTPTSFFKVLIAMDFTDLLRLPPAVTKKYELTESVKLKSHSGRRSWKVKVERMENEQFCFTRGWQAFAEEAALRLGEFIVFSELAKSEFVVEIYKTDFCTRPIPPNEQNYVESTTRECPSSKKDNPLYFEIRLKQHQQSRIILPKRFCDAAGLNERKKVVKVEYEDEDGNRRSEMVSTDLRPKKSTDLTKGWPRFREANGFIYGKNYSFEFIPGQNVIRVREVAAFSSSSSNEAGGTEDQIPSFMMFGLWKSSSTLCIPVKFVAKYEQIKDQESMDLENDRGKSWEVRMEKDKYENCYMKEGWPEFKKDNEISDTDFLVFRLVGDSTFNVKIYSSNGCLKQPAPPTISEKGGGDENESEIRVKRGRGRPRKKHLGNNPLYFETCLRGNQTSRVSLPREFALASKMKDKTKVRLEFLPGRHCVSVFVVHHDRTQRYRVDLGKGWNGFRKANGIEVGKNYSFEFMPQENVIHVKEMEE